MHHTKSIYQYGKKAFLLTLLVIGISLNAIAQEKLSLERKRYKSVYLEFLGASNLIGISYDSRLSPTSHWGYRIGISYYQGGNSYSSPNRGVFFPIEFNHLIGKNKHKLEIGLGSNLGIYNQSISYIYASFTEDIDNQSAVIQSTSQTTFGYYLFSNIGYRYLSNKGFLFRIGLNPSFNFKDKHGITKEPSVYPYISFGYSF